MINDVTTDFKTYHFSIIDQIEEEEGVKAEQDILYQHARAQGYGGDRSNREDNGGSWCPS